MRQPEVHELEQHDRGCAPAEFHEGEDQAAKQGTAGLHAKGAGEAEGDPDE